jgi:uncharacterized protein YecT (DUF1311 family)
VAAQGVDCANAQTQIDMNACSARKAPDADPSLSRIYARLRMKYRDSPTSSELSAAQSAWLAFRAAACRFSAGRYFGGSMAPLFRNGCLEQLTAARTAQLESYLKEGG